MEYLLFSLGLGTLPPTLNPAATSTGTPAAPATGTAPSPTAPPRGGQDAFSDLMASMVSVSWDFQYPCAFFLNLFLAGFLAHFFGWTVRFYWCW